MPVDVRWYESEQKNIVYYFEGRWTWEEAHTAIDKVADILDTINYPIYLIIDFRQTPHIPAVNFDALNRIAKARGTYHPNTRGLIVIGLKYGITMVFNVFQRVFSKAASRYRVVKDKAELEAILRMTELV